MTDFVIYLAFCLVCFVFPLSTLVLLARISRKLNVLKRES